MQRPTGLKPVPFLTLAVVLGASAMPFLLSLLGVSFGPAIKGGAGSHFAGIHIGEYMIRMDVAACGLLVFLVILGTIYYRVAPNRFVNLIGASLLMGGLALSFQIVPLQGPDGQRLDFARQVVVSTTIGHLGTAVILLTGSLFFRYGPRRVPRQSLGPLLPVGSLILLLTWVTMTGRLGNVAPVSPHLQVAAMGVYLASALVLRPNLRPRILHFFRLGFLTLLIPQITALLWLRLGQQTIFDQGFHVASLLWWLGLLLPVLGLGIDFINVYYSLGMAGEKRYLRMVIDAIPHFIFARDTKGRFTLVNKAVADFYGKKVKDIEGRHLGKIHPDKQQAEQWLEEDRQTLASGQHSTIEEAQAVDAKGQPIWIDAIKTPLTGQGVYTPQVLGISIDITPQKRAEEALAKRLRFELTATSVLREFIRCTVQNRDRQMEETLHQVADFAHAARCGIYQFQERETLLLHSWHKGSLTEDQKLPASLSPSTLDWARRSLEWGKPWTATGHDDYPDEAFPFLEAWNSSPSQPLMLIPILSQDTLFGFLGVDAESSRPWGHEDTILLRNVADLFITVWSKLEAEKGLTEAMENAKASSLAKSEFLANMSHEIRTPMNCVIGISELLREMDPTDSQRQYLEMISSSGTSLLALINDILDLSKIEAGQLELDPIKANLRDMVEEAVGLIAFNAQAKGLEMVCRYAPGAPDVVICDANRLRQVLTNLLNNAYKFTKSGHIYLNVEPVGEKNGRLQLRFQVTDTGIGIPRDKVDRIFEKFTQAETGTTRRFGGTGLGLSISKQLVQLMGGEIKVTSKDGEGSTFTFTVPVEEVPGTLQAPTHVAEPQSSILVISNHQLGCEVLAEQVRHLGYECTTALGCQQGLKELDRIVPGETKSWSFILVDQDVLSDDTPLIMEFLSKVPEADRPHPILMTSLSSITREKDLQSRGFTRILTKPVRPHRLAEVLNGAGSDSVSAMPESASCLVEPENDEIPVSGDQHSDRPLVLLAEDNPFNQKVAVGMLNLLGCQVEVASNGVEALDLVGKNDYRVVFMDCQMPEMDGYEATERIRQLRGHRSTTPIIAMTANALSGDRRACFASGMNDFLSKPITKAMLSDMLTKWEVLPQTVDS